MVTNNGTIYRHTQNGRVDDVFSLLPVQGFMPIMESLNKLSLVADTVKPGSIDALAEKSLQALLEIHTARPFDMFPSTITVDMNKVDVAVRGLLRPRELYTVLIRDIQDIVITTTGSFSSVEIVTNAHKPPSLYYVRTPDAVDLKKMIMGLVVCTREKVPLSALSIDHVREKASEIGVTPPDRVVE